MLRLGYSAPTPCDLAAAFGVEQPESKQHLRDANAARAAMVDIFRSQRPVFQPALQAVQGYLPYALALMQVTENSNNVDREKPLKLIWTHCIVRQGYPLTATADFMRFDVAFTLFNLAMLKWQHAYDVLQNPDDSKDSTTEAATLFREASGIFEFNANNIMGRWPVNQIPVEINPKVLNAFSQICVSHSQAIAFRRAENKNLAPSLVTKLCVEVLNKFKAAQSFLTGLVRDDFHQLDHSIYPFVKLSAERYSYLSYMYYAEECSKEARHGLSVALIAKAQSLQRSIVAPAGLEAERLASLMGTVNTEGQEILKLHQQYKADNDRVYYELVPNVSATPLPEGKGAMSTIAYTPPDPAFNDLL